ncbi:hypothetical protein SeLEV6574_g00910 [Synchytrium endobioticum]|uniref:Uncharacterized protein n=1 Tax=Synchytrium endobioticum TaxID=286115 RepID=A0A507DFM3_9FUNG|nr:hypothetical protein SeLEV6574_g00910 [Synchytrium endobioticum]
MTAPFCPGPYLDNGIIAPCLVDIVLATASLILASIVAAVWWISHHAGCRNATLRNLQDDSQPLLLNGADDSLNDPQSNTPPCTGDAFPRVGRLSLSSSVRGTPPTQSSLARFLVTLTKVFSSLVLITYLISLGIDLYHATHTERLAHVVIQPAKAALDLILTFAWLIFTTFLFFVSTLSLEGAPTVRPLPAPLIVYWVGVLLGETVPLCNWIILYAKRNYLFGLDYVYFGIIIARYLFILGGLVGGIVYLMSKPERSARQSSDDIEGDSNQRNNRPRQNSNSLQIGNFRDHILGTIRKPFPFLWPSDSLYLQFLVVACLVLLVLGRIVNVLVPYNYKAVVDALTPGGSEEAGDKRPYFAWGLILIFVALRFLQGGVGLLSSLQSYLWIPVGQYTTRKISVRMLEHLHNLSLNFHLNRKTGEVLRIMDRGTNSIGSLLSYLLFNITPVFVDIIAAVVFFIYKFGWVFGTIVFLTMTLYIIATIAITEWRSKFRREMIEFDNAARQRAVDSLLNYETVKYYNAERREVELYDEAMIKYLRADFTSSASLNILNTAQNLIITLGLLVGSLLCAKEVADGLLSTGDFVMFLTYITQLYVPLNWFGTYYRVIQQNFIDMEKMLELFNENTAIQDTVGATQLQIRAGATIAFEDVFFAYDPRQPILKGISFTVPAGKTVALVGPTGAGKSSILRLLFRFYDVSAGRITIDDQDIRNVTQVSLRQAIGVVPQDAVLFNNTIRYNIQYGRYTSTQEEVERAADAAQIHDKIVNLVDGYDTRVGERGLRLSGGEKQRVAIARTILKNPSIATSALDSMTERLVQTALRSLCSNRTTLIIAHRLSTIVDADLILVVKDGRIVERGTHQQLISNGEEKIRILAAGKVPAETAENEHEGSYYEMWMEQLESDREKIAETQDSTTSVHGLRQRQTATFIPFNGSDTSAGLKLNNSAAGRSGGSSGDTGLYHSHGGGGGGFH